MQIFHKVYLSIMLVLQLVLASCSYLTETTPQTHAISSSHQGYVEVTGGRLYYQTFGQGDPIIMLHGGPGMDQNYLLPQMLELAKENKITFYDQRGSGKSLVSELNTKMINVGQFVEDLEDLRKHLGYDRFTLIGHSWGGRLAMEYAIRHPESLSKLILLNPTPATYNGQAAFAYEVTKRVHPFKNKIKPLFEYKEFTKLSTTEISSLYRRFFSAYCHQHNDSDKLSLTFDKHSAASGLKVMEIMSQSSWLQKDFDLTPQLSKLEVPTLILHGATDPIPVWTAEEIKNAILNANLVVLKNCGHFPYVEQPTQFFNEIRKFL